MNTFKDLLAMQEEFSKKIDALIIPQYIDAMIEVRKLCKQHREIMGCSVSA
jgi:hypothetical protein